MNDGVMIALLPISAEWSKMDPPHMTLVYAGKEEDYKDADRIKLINAASSLAIMNSPITVRVLGLDVYGPSNERVDAFKLQLTPELAAMRSFVEMWNKSEYTIFDPHVTVGPSPSMVMDRPAYIAFDRVMLACGDKRYTFNMTRR